MPWVLIARDPTGQGWGQSLAYTTREELVHAIIEEEFHIEHLEDRSFAAKEYTIHEVKDA